MSKFGLLLVLLVSVIFHVTESSNFLSALPNDLLFTILDYSSDLQEIRGTCKDLKRRFEDYLRKHKFKLKQGNYDIVQKYGLIRTWQLSNILAFKDGDNLQRLDEQIRAQAYRTSTTKSRNHLKLIRFLAEHVEFERLFTSMKADVKGFINPNIEYYKNKIHGLDEFVKAAGCEHLCIENHDDDDKSGKECEVDDCAWGHELDFYLMIFQILQLLQG